MFSLPHANAVLTKIEAAGGTPDWDDAATAGATKWEGQADAFIRDTRRREISDGRTDWIDVRRVSLPEGIQVETSDVLTLTFRGEQLIVPVLALLAHEAPPGVSGGSVVEVELS